MAKRGQISPRQGEILRFLHEWMNSIGKTLADLPGDNHVGTKLSEVFGFTKQSGVQFVIQLRAAGCFGNPSDERIAAITKERIQVLRECYKALNGDHAELRQRILTVL